jgi:predicted 3-demethylubiquinone-9 3-methyltransferase (glyoxalase superfamily)
MNKIIPHLWFQTDVRQVAEYYNRIFKDSQVHDTTTVQDPNGAAVQIVSMQILGLEVMLLSAPAPFSLNDSFSFIVNCHTQEEIDHYWSALTADGGAESMCGWLKDKFGLSWQIVPDNINELMSDADKDRFERVSKVLFASVKLNINDLMKAYNNA